MEPPQAFEAGVLREKALSKNGGRTPPNARQGATATENAIFQPLKEPVTALQQPVVNPRQI